jgi:hypothetical protein
MPPTGFEPTIPAIERPETPTPLERAITGIGTQYMTPTKCTVLINSILMEHIQRVSVHVYHFSVAVGF